jgi:hypothetical protein
MTFWFWTSFVGAIILWYILVTILVGIKGAGSIRDMFKQLRNPSKSNGKQI